MDMTQMNGMEPMGPMMMILMVLVWVLVIGGVVWLVWRLFRRRTASGRTPGDHSAERILKERYARGEIDRSTYERMREDLEGRPGSE